MKLPEAWPLYAKWFVVWLAVKPDEKGEKIPLYSTSLHKISTRK